ncbi:uncharacterized protein si:ch73-30l9.1 [Sander lucioperca]|uniref:uncharacterized protein si:ch73-30l9.1 n=1 Tax=Sander lucioperca TaxID=283035 RepID=UPI00125E35ED|nr:uncharacterized protein si:ch73-30l9.1 [Sander lucioperca]
MDQSFHKFLREQRRLNETVVTTFINEKIDCYAVHGMTDDQLMKYVPKIGEYCRTEVAALEGTTTTISKATESLMKKIKERQASKRSHGDDHSENLSGNSNALKMECVFQMGLFEEVWAKNVQVKEKRGGGTRHLKALTSTMAQLMEIGKELFFPNGKSKIGNVNDFEFRIQDFTEDELDPLTTLGEQYEKRKVRMLRLYLSCIKIDAEEILNDATSPGESQNAVPLTRELLCAAAASYGAASTTGTTCGSDFTTGTPRTKASTREIVQEPAHISECWSSALKRLKLPPGGVDEVLASLTPTPRKVVAMLQHETQQERKLDS